MRLTVCNQTNESIAQIEIDSTAPLVHLQAMIAVEFPSIPEERQVLMHDGKVLIGGDDTQAETTTTTTSTIESKGIRDDDMILVTMKHAHMERTHGAPRGSSSMTMGAGQRTERGTGGPRDVATNHTDEENKSVMDLMANLKREIEFGGGFKVPPELEKILRENDVKAFTEYMSRMNESKRKEEEMYARLERDPFDVEAQKEIEKIIKRKRNDETLEQVMQDSPELIFGNVIMLYCNMEVNGHKMKAFIDSGAQASIMGFDCAKQCNLVKDINEVFQGTAVGVGTQKIVGKVPRVHIKVGNANLECSLSVLEGQKMEFIFGLDMLKRHQCVIDLKKNVLKIGTTGDEIPFLGEGDIPNQMHQEEKQQDATMNTTDNNNNNNNNNNKVLVPDVAEVSGVHERPSRPATTEISGVVSPPLAGGLRGERAGGTADAFPEVVVSNLMQLGFSRERVVQALEATGGNAETAASLLFSD